MAAADSFCRVTENGIAFSFSTNHIGITKMNDELCATVAHGIGHLLALEHNLRARHDVLRAVRVRQPEELHQRQLAMRHNRAGHHELQLHADGLRAGDELGHLAHPVPRSPSGGDGATNAGSDLARQQQQAATSELLGHRDGERRDRDGRTRRFVDGVMVASSGSPQGTTYTIAVTNVAEGSHTLEVQAVGAFAGNVTKKQIAITVALGGLGENVQRERRL